jgi:hypothetical protein
VRLRPCVRLATSKARLSRAERRLLKMSPTVVLIEIGTGRRNSGDTPTARARRSARASGSMAWSLGTRRPESVANRRARKRGWLSPTMTRWDHSSSNRSSRTPGHSATRARASTHDFCSRVRNLHSREQTPGRVVLDQIEYWLSGVCNMTAAPGRSNRTTKARPPLLADRRDHHRSGAYLVESMKTIDRLTRPNPR